MDVWDIYSNPVYRISLQYPADWQPVPGFDGPDGRPLKFAAINGFFHINAMDAPSIEDAASGEAEHHLQPYGSQPIIESLQVQSQEARLILPSADQAAGMNYQAALIVTYPQPVGIAGSTYRYFVLWADQSHIRTIAQTLRFTTDSAPSATDTPPPPNPTTPTSALPSSSTPS
jgi:TolB protein